MVMGTIPPFYNQQLFEQCIQKLNMNIQDRSYQQTINDATFAIEYIVKSHLLVLLDVRAQAYYLQCQQETAITDAQRMIQYSPESAAGYIRQGYILTIHGYQRRAIDLYKRGIQNIQSVWHRHGDNSEVQKLEACIKEATELDDRRVDFFSKLPTECVDNIISLLPSMEEKAMCMLVNNAWRQRIIECIGISMWECFSVKGGKDDKILAKAAPHFAHLTNILTFDTANDEICNTYMKLMIENHTKKLHTLNITYGASSNLKKNTILLTKALYQSRYTLRKLTIDMGFEDNVVSLAEIVSACCNITDISYFTMTRTLASQFIGDFSNLDQHGALNNLKLHSDRKSVIKGYDIDKMLQKCPKLRRLEISKCDTSVLDSIKQHAPRLKIFLYNITRYDSDRYSYLQNESKDDFPGLQMLIVAQPVATLLPLISLIYKNRVSLSALHIMGALDLSSAEIKQINTTYPDFKFQNLKILNFTCLPRIQNLLLEASFDTTPLSTLIGRDIMDIKIFIKCVQRLPLLNDINIMMHDHHTTNADRSKLIQLFEIFAKRFRAGLPSLKNVTLQKFPEMNDAVLDTLANVGTLERVSLLCGSKNITALGMNRFIHHMREFPLKYISLDSMDAVSDVTLAALCECNCLDSVNLMDPTNVTEKGVHHLLYNTKSIHFKQVNIQDSLVNGNTKYFLKGGEVCKRMNVASNE